MYYRRDGRTSWVRSLVIMLDAAALLRATAPRWSPPSTTALLRVGIDCLAALADELAVQRAQLSAVSLHGREQVGFEDTLRVVNAGRPHAERTAAHDAWTEFQRWRVQYAPLAAAIWAVLDVEEPIVGPPPTNSTV